jgi:hypothetical protein
VEQERQEKDTARFNLENKKIQESEEKSINLSSICLNHKNSLNNTLLDNSILEEICNKS